MASFLADLDEATAIEVINMLWDDLDREAAENSAYQQPKRKRKSVRDREKTRMDDVSTSLDLQKQELSSHLTSLVDRLFARKLDEEEDDDDNDDGGGGGGGSSSSSNVATEDGTLNLSYITDKIRSKSSFGCKLAARIFGVEIDVLMPFLSDAEVGEVLPAAEYFVWLREQVKRSTVTKHEEDEPGGNGEQSKNEARTFPCVCCMADFTPQEIVICPCSHNYCDNCLRDFFRRALADESLFPPTCCSEPIPAEDETVQATLGENLVAEFRDKREEFETQDRTYCHVQECAVWISPRHISTADGNNIGSCPKCQATTCTTCKAASHQGTDCPQDEGTKSILDLARQERWRQCYSCHRVVELRTGCYHITCFCDAEFCYLCGERWKTCTCIQCAEDRLIEDGELLPDDELTDDGLTDDELRDVELPDDEPPPVVWLEEQVELPQPPPELPELPVVLPEVQAELPEPPVVLRARRRRRRCLHRDEWRRVDGEWECEHCEQVMFHFIDACWGCNFRVCRRCRRTRAWED